MSNNAPKSSLKRILIPLAAVMLGLLVVLSQMRPDKADPEQAETEVASQEPAKKDAAPTPNPDAGDKADDPDEEPDPTPDDTETPEPAGLTLSEADLTEALTAFKLQAEDVVLTVNGDAATDVPALLQAFATTDELELVIRRAGVDKPITLNADGEVKAPVKIDPLQDLRPVYADRPEPAPAKKSESAENESDTDASEDAATDPDAGLTLYALGSADPDNEDDYKLLAQINPYRACIHRVTLSQISEEANSAQRYVLLHPVDLNLGDTNYPTIGSYAAEFIVINGERVRLFEKNDAGEWLGNWELKSQTDDSVTLTLTIDGGPKDHRKPVARITRTYRVAPGSQSVGLTQTVANLTADTNLDITWQQLAQGDVHYAKNDYLRGRSRQYVAGYFRETYDPGHFSVYVDDAFLPRPDLVKDLKNPKDPGKRESVWPNYKVDDDEETPLVWLASDNRFFAAITSAQTGEDVEETADVTALQAVYPTITTTVYPNVSADKDMSDDDRVVLIGLISHELTLKPGESTAAADLSLDLYAGPRSDEIFDQAPYAALGFDKTIRYSLGGFCGICTFQWLAHLLLGLLNLLHAITFDWGIAIILLVLIVRLCLHPLTKRGQINMMKMGKQMAAVQPELDKLKKKYADDPRQMQQEQMRLFREKGINPAAGAMGCLPMLFQMPIWIALYAMLYYVIELRHEPAFYGVFQNIAGWPFLADLSSADRFIPLFKNDGTHLLNLWFIRLDYSSINVLPILMGITFFINMKYTTPPPMNDQQATQQKIMRIMPLLFPFFLYSAPSSLTLYICASTFAGIIDSRIVRKHINQLEESGDLFKPKERKPGGFMDKLHKAAEMKAAQAEEAKKQQQKNKGPQNKKKRKR